MSTTTIIFMLIAMILIWGGLILATLHLIKNPDLPMEE